MTPLIAAKIFISENSHKYEVNGFSIENSFPLFSQAGSVAGCKKIEELPENYKGFLGRRHTPSKRISLIRVKYTSAPSHDFVRLCVDKFQGTVFTAFRCS